MAGAIHPRASCHSRGSSVHVEDQYGVGVDGYLMEFYEKDDDLGNPAKEFHASAIRNVHKLLSLELWGRT